MNFKEFIKPTITKIIISIIGSVVFTVYVFGTLLAGAGPVGGSGPITFRILGFLLWPLTLLPITDLRIIVPLVIIYLFLLIYLITSLIILIIKRK